jgi:HAD superfamily hydrolase (TIGR01509 family)
LAGGIQAIFFDFYGVLELNHQPNDLVVDLARRLKQRYRIGVISNASARLEERLRNGWGAIADFDAVITSGRTGFQKPLTPIFEHAARSVSLTPESCVHIDDSQLHVDGARHAGFRAVLYTGDIAALEGELRQLGVKW